MSTFESNTPHPSLVLELAYWSGYAVLSTYEYCLLC